METLVLDGKEFIKASRAAKELGYTADYVGQLCRSGKVSAHLVGRSWYVHKDELSSHKVKKKRISRSKAREQAKRAIAEHKAQQVTIQKASPDKKVVITYESDDSELIPQTRRLSIDSEMPRQPKLTKIKKKDTGPAYIIENKGKKVVMSGTLDVVDVTDGPVDPEATILTPKIIHTDSKAKTTTKKETKPEKQSPQKLNAVEGVREEIDTTLKGKTDFKDRLVAHGAVSTNKNEVVAEPAAQEDESNREPEISVIPSETESTAPKSRLVLKIVLASAVLLSLFSVTIESSRPYERTEVGGNNKEYRLEIRDTIDKILLKI